MPESFLTTHPHIRRIVYGACALAGLGVLGTWFGWENVWSLVERLLEKAGLIAPGP